MTFTPAMLCVAAQTLAQAPAVDGGGRAIVLGGTPRTTLVSAAPTYAIELPATVAPQPVEAPGLLQMVGYIEPPPMDLFPENQWVQTAQGYILRGEFHSADALGLRFKFRGSFGSDGLELRVYDPFGTAVFGPFRGRATRADGTWWAPTIYGHTIGVEFFLPLDAPFPPRMPELVGISYEYDSDGIAQGGDCLEDVMCHNDWEQDASSVGRMRFEVDGGTGGCTGATLNRSGTDLCPIFMTARHCISTQASADSLEVVWFYQTDDCDGDVPSPNDLPRNDGSLLLKTNDDSEWTLLGLYEPAQTNWYLGWDSGNLGDGNDVVGIHHPGGSWKRITYGEKTDNDDCLGATNELFVETSLGAVRPGSSGSPVFDTSHRVRGTASCAGPDKNNSCPPDEWVSYGNLNKAFGIVRWYIYQMADPAYVDNSVGGDGGNDGSSERGTAANPFNTFYEGTFCVPTGGELRIDAGTYDEPVLKGRRLWRAMTLKASGGTVRIHP
jgi:hypothetical protein